MKCVIPEISWHNRDPVLSVDFQPVMTRTCELKSTYRLATAGTDTHVLIWLATIDEKGGANLEFVSDLRRHNKAVNVVRFSPSGEFLASGDDEAAIWLWKQQDKGSRDGGDLFIDDDEKENKEHWTAVRTLRGHFEDVYDLCWSPKSNFLVSGSVDNSAIIWDVEKGRNVGLLSDHKGFVQGVAWDPRDQYIATLCSDRMCRIYNIASKKVAHRLYKANLSTTVATVKKVERLNDVPVESTPPQKASRLFHDDTLKSFFRRLVFTPDGELLITPAGIVEVDDGPLLNVTHVFSRHSLTKPVFYLPSKDKHTLAVRCCPTLFKLRPVKGKETVEGDPEQNQPWKSYSTMLKLPYRMVFAIATQDSVLFYDTQQPTPFARVANIQYTRLSDLSWSSDGRILIVSSTDGYCSFVTFGENELGVAYQQDPVTFASPEITTVATSCKTKAKEDVSSPINIRTSQTTTPIASPCQNKPTGRKKVSLITLLSPKLIKKDCVPKSASISIKTFVENKEDASKKGMIEAIGEEPMPMDISASDDLEAIEKPPAKLPCASPADGIEQQIRNVISDVLDEIDRKCCLMVVGDSDQSRPLITSSCSSPTIRPSTVSAHVSPTVRQPRRVQLVTLSTTPKSKKIT